MDDVTYAPMGDIALSPYFGPGVLARMSGEMRLMVDCDCAPGNALQVAALWDSFRATLVSILALPEIDHAF